MIKSLLKRLATVGGVNGVDTGCDDTKRFCREYTDHLLRRV